MFKNIIIVILSLAFISGCQRVHSNISSFSELSNYVHNKTFYILPNDQQKTSVEFKKYANSIAYRLIGKGWRRANTINDAEFVALINYGVSGSNTKTSSVPIYGQTGGGYTTHSGSVYGSTGGYGNYSGTSYTMPSFGVVGSQNISVTHYQRYFHFKMLDMKNDPVYETKAASEGTNATFGIVAECIFDLALKDFPQPVQKNETIFMDDCGK